MSVRRCARLGGLSGRSAAECGPRVEKFALFIRVFELKIGRGHGVALRMRQCGMNDLLGEALRFSPARGR